MVILVERILVANLTALSKINVEQHIAHDYIKEMNGKSNIVRYTFMI